MRKLGRLLLFGAVGLVILLAIAITFTISWRPFLGPKARALTSRRFEATPQRLDRGRYLANSLTGCLDCHSPRDWSKHGAPIIAGKEGSGAIFPANGLPGRIVAPNITPDRETGIGNWSDDQIGRAIREGIGHDGRALFPIMPYAKFRAMSDEDLASIVVYLRSLPAIRHALEPTSIDFPVKYLIRSAPQPITAPVNAPNPSDRLKWGEYLVTLGACSECHTASEQGRAIAGLEYAGGTVFSGPFGEVAAANITPDPSGIAYYDEALFVETMRTGYVKARALNSIMPFGVYGKLTDDDLKAMFAYLQTLKPVSHRVDNGEPPTYCKLCRQKHGGGSLN